jgi:TolB-like protein/tRNA A-37 threonylcarbamoyl transferase component Bud32/cytochrome c-type biogenesis protein CcmH/NrfG
MTGETLGHYHILGKIGAGGMGEVYRARDSKLGREVALKVLPPDMARDPERLARFQREARAVAALNHPHIVTIYSVEELDGVHFLTMELVEGQSLDRRISENGLPLDQIVEIASALADALAAAHEKGIVHRDLKPANVMVTGDGRVKVLDFGLAKDVSAEKSGDATLTSAGHTQAGMVMGTPAYMSPEQISGRVLDHRTDIFSLGVVLHEMATGKRPFEGTSSAELVSAILRDAPPSITDLRADLPMDLARIIRRCLEKDPRHRMQTARDVANEFRDLTRQPSQKTTAAAPSTTRAVAAADSGSSRAEEGFWVAVLPFKYSGGNADLTSLAEGMTEDIVTGLSRFSYLRVIARSSTSRYANEAVDVRSAGKELGARYVMEGTLRQAGTKLRIAVQLVDAISGAHLWAETYLHSFNPEAIFELQDELVPRIVATVADTRGVLPHTMSEMLRGKPPEQLSPYEAVLRSFAYFQRINAEEHAIVRTALERAVQQAPANADAWAFLSILYREEYTHEFNLLPDPIGRAYAAATRAIECSPSNHYGHHALASVLFFRKELGAFQSAALRAIALNPMDGFTYAYMGSLFAYSGDWERGCAFSEKARSINPHHPGWYWFVPLYDAYRKGDYRRALEIALKVNMPGFWRTQAALAATYGQLGELELARNAVQQLLAIRKDFPAVAYHELGKWHYPELIEQLIDGLRKAGLEIADAPAKPRLSSIVTTSGAVRADEGFWVAVLPFKSTSTELTSLAEGLSEEIVTGLSRFSYLRVIARGSTLKYASRSTDLRTVGKELGARYVMEGSLRQAGAKLRVAVQLVDATTGTQMWAETYERAFSPEAIFEVQDDLVPRIVATVADHDGILPQSMAEVLRTKSEDQLTPHEAVLRSFRFFRNIDPEEHATAKRILERAVRSAPNHGDSWAMLSHMYSNDYWHGRDSGPEDVDRALAAARRAVDVTPSNHLSYWALALALYCKRDLPACRLAAERAIELNRMDGSSVAFMACLIANSGDWERGCAIAEHASALNPNHSGWHRHLAVYNAYNKGDYQAARTAADRLNMPANFQEPAMRAAIYGQLGEPDLAQKAVREVLALEPDFARAAPVFYPKMLNPELVKHLIEGWRKAGLQIASTLPTS